MTDRTLASEMIGEPVAMPVALAPTGLTGMQHADGEILAAQAAEAFGVPFCLSTMSICSIEDVAAQHDEAVLVPALRHARPRLHREPDRPGQGGGLLGAGADARPADPRAAPQGPAQRPLAPRRSGRRSMPGRSRRGRSGASTCSEPGGAASATSSATRRTSATSPRSPPGPTNSSTRACPGRTSPGSRRSWGGKLILKGILDPEDARQAVDTGADAIIVSNHGGRQLDGARSSISALPGIVEAVGDRIEVHIDGGIRSGQDVLKARRPRAPRAPASAAPSSTASAPAARQASRRALEIIRNELDISMALCGKRDIREVDADILDAA